MYLKHEKQGRSSRGKSLSRLESVLLVQTVIDYYLQSAFGERETSRSRGRGSQREREKEKGRDYFKELAHKIVKAW